MTTAVDLTKPALGDAYASFQSEIVAGLQAAGAMYDTTYWTTTSQPAGTKRFNASSSLLESWNGSAWVNALAVLQTGNTGTQTVVGTVNYSGTLQLGGNLVATQAWVTSQSYETTSALSATLANYALTSALSSYVLTSALASASVASATTAGTYTSTGVSLAATGQGAGRAAAVAPFFTSSAGGYVTFPPMPSSGRGGPFGGSYSIEAWVSTTGQITSEPRILTVSELTSGSTGEINFKLNAGTTQLKISHYAPVTGAVCVDPGVAITSRGLTFGIIHHVVAVVALTSSPQSASVTFYIDGVQEAGETPQTSYPQGGCGDKVMPYVYVGKSLHGGAFVSLLPYLGCRLALPTVPASSYTHLFLPSHRQTRLGLAPSAKL